MSTEGDDDSRRAWWLRAAVPAPGPIRTLTQATLANTIGNGVFYTVEIIFFTRSVGLPVHLVALGLGISAVAGLVVAVPVGHAADRWDPRHLVALSLAAATALTASFTLVHRADQFFVLITLAGVAEAASGASRSAMMAHFGSGEERVAVRAYQRAVTNLGISFGLVLAGVGLAVDTRAAYVLMVLGNALSFSIAALFVLRLPSMRPEPPAPGSRRAPMTVVLKDRRYLTASLLAGLFSIHFSIQSVGLPLWIVYRTHAPRWWVSPMLVLNTIMVITLQVRMSRGAGDVRRAARIYARSGILLGVACVLYGLSGGLATVLASAVLIAGILVHTLGELFGSGASWGIGYGLAREDLQGQYQGAYGVGFGVSRALGPIVVTALVMGAGTTGWLILAGAFALIGAGFTPLIRSYERAGMLAEGRLS